MVIFRIVNDSMSAEAIRDLSHLITLKYEECKNTDRCLVVSKDVEDASAMIKSFSPIVP